MCVYYNVCLCFLTIGCILVTTHLVQGSLLLPTHLPQQTSNNRVSDDTVNFYDVNVV